MQLLNLVTNMVNLNCFLFSEILIKNRDILKEGESFVITLYKEINKQIKKE